MTSAGFQKYDSMKLDQRQEQITRANWLLGGRPIYFPPISAGSDDDLKDRLNSNGNASTSEQSPQVPQNGRTRRRQPADKSTKQSSPARNQVASGDSYSSYVPQERSKADRDLPVVEADKGMAG